jgi:hypothetical protein
MTVRTHSRFSFFLSSPLRSHSSEGPPSRLTREAEGAWPNCRGRRYIPTSSLNARSAHPGVAPGYFRCCCFASTRNYTRHNSLSLSIFSIDGSQYSTGCHQSDGCHQSMTVYVLAVISTGCHQSSTVHVTNPTLPGSVLMRQPYSWARTATSRCRTRRTPPTWTPP